MLIFFSLSLKPMPVNPPAAKRKSAATPFKKGALQDALLTAYQDLAPLENPRLDAEILLAHVLKKPRSFLLAWPEQMLTVEQSQQFLRLLEYRLEGKTIAHILGEKEFWSLSLEVTQDTLIPRPDTELLVERVLHTLPADIPQTVADLGTGSGAIALAIAKERPHWQIIATDNYPATLAVARRNADKLSLKNVTFYAGDWCEALPPGLLHAVISNPPYIAFGDPHLLSPELSCEPHHALVSGHDGLQALNIIIEQAHKHLAQDGWLFLEHGFDQALAVREKMKKAGYKNSCTYRDLGENPRVTVGQKKA